MIADRVEFSKLPFPAAWNVPTSCRGRILIGGLAQGNREAYYLIDFNRRVVESCEIDVRGYAAVMASYLRDRVPAEHLPYGLRDHAAAVPAYVQPHEGLELPDGRIAFALHNAGFLRELEFVERHAASYPREAEFTPVMLSATNSLDPSGERLVYAESDLDARLQRYIDRSTPVPTRVRTVDAGLRGSATTVCSLETEEAVHEVKACPDGRHILLTEFCLVARGEPPPASDDVFATAEPWQPYERAGLEHSRLYLVDGSAGTCSSILPDGRTPGHVEFSKTDPARFYLSCHNLSKCHGRLLLHGLGKLIAIRLAPPSLEVVGEFSDERFLRVTSHKVYEYRGQPRIVVTVYPNRFYILSDPDLAVIEDVELFPHPALEHSGLVFCTLPPHLPIWIETSADGRYVILVSNEVVYLYDQDHRQLHSFSGYSFRGSFIGTAHIKNLDDQ
jgi:hypothetical protein